MITRTPPKIQPTEETLGELHDELETAVEFAQTVFLALRDRTMGGEAQAVASVVSHLQERLEKARDTLHDMVEWVS